MVAKNTCPVCGYLMEEPPEQYNICASCGTEFSVHDVNSSIEELRMAWLETGPEWFSAVDPEPANWNPFQQLGELLLRSSIQADSSSRSESVTFEDPAASQQPSTVDTQFEVVYV